MLWVSCLLVLLPRVLAFNGTALPALNIDKTQTTVSGLSAGGYMAVQMHVAFSSWVQGAAVFAAGPYNCAQGNLNTALGPCMQALTPPSLNAAISTTNSRSSSGVIDPITNIDDDNVFLFSGTRDTTVSPRVTDVLAQYYQHFITGGNVVYLDTMNAAHTYPTDDRVNTNACTTASSPYISFCDYDGAGQALQQLLGPLQPRNDGTLTGEIIQWTQAPAFIPTGRGIAPSGFMYVPISCMKGALCRLHIAFHGCLQNRDQIGMRYVENTGYNKWADTNNIVILYPQTVASQFSPQNPNGCFDWWGYNNNGNNYDTKAGLQMSAMDKAVTELCRGYAPISPPTNLHSTSVGETKAALAWTASDGAVSYNIYRNGANVGNSLVLTFEDMGLTPGTQFTYAVSALTSTGGESERSDSIDVTTHGDPPPILPPANVNAGDATRTSLNISWSPAHNAVAYNVYRDGSLANTASIEGLSFVDTGLQEETTYTYTATSLTEVGYESAQSTAVQGTTLGGPPCQQFHSSNWEHVNANRAVICGINACAVGSNDNLGIYSTLTESTVHTGGSGPNPSYYYLGPCPSRKKL